MKKAIKWTVLVLTLILLVGCGGKTLSNDKIIKQLEGQGYSVYIKKSGMPSVTNDPTTFSVKEKFAFEPIVASDVDDERIGIACYSEGTVYLSKKVYYNHYFDNNKKDTIGTIGNLYDIDDSACPAALKKAGEELKTKFDTLLTDSKLSFKDIENLMKTYDQ